MTRENLIKVVAGLLGVTVSFPRKEDEEKRRDQEIKIIASHEESGDGTVHFDDPVERLLREAAALRSETHLTLGNLISYLENTEDHLVANLSHPHSYRGYYSDLAFEQDPGKISSKALLATCKKLVGKVFVGYKGGEYKMTLTTPLWVVNWGANWGACGRPLIALNGTNVTLGD